MRQTSLFPWCIITMDAAVVSGSDVPHDHYDSSSSEDDDLLIGRRDGLNESGINHPRPGLSDILEGSDDEGEGEGDGDVSSRRKYNIPQKDHLYNPDEDDEDEAYVYKHLRHGVEENVDIRRKKSNKQEENTSNANGTSMSQQQKQQSNGSHPSSQQTKLQNQRQSFNAEVPFTSLSTSASNAAAFNLEQAKILKPRSSDAVLSCPCCFQIVCMDCQRHERYTNQFRAMFVMNIDVRWDVHVDVDVDVDEGAAVTEGASGEDMRNRSKRSRPNDEGKSESENGDVFMSEMGPSSVPAIPSTRHDEKKVVYHSVVCNSCQTEVAALDMRDEVYHFFGCLVSS